MNRTPLIASALFALTAVSAAVALAQPEAEPTPADRRTQVTVDRMMSNDKDGDGKLSKEELPARMVATMFEEADTDKDGFLTREEVEAHVLKRRPGNRTNAPEGERPGGPGQQPAPAGDDAGGFDGLMKQAGQAMRGLRRSEFTADTRESDLAAVQQVQEAMVRAKDLSAAEKMAPQAKEKYGDDMATYTKDMRMSFLVMLRATMDLEQAILEGDSAAALTALQAVLDAQKASHDAFQAED